MPLFYGRMQTFHALAKCEKFPKIVGSFRFGTNSPCFFIHYSDLKLQFLV